MQYIKHYKGSNPQICSALIKHITVSNFSILQKDSNDIHH